MTSLDGCGSRSLRLVCVLAAALLTACQAALPEGVFECERDVHCPPSWSCVMVSGHGRCWSRDPELDASTSVPEVDASTPLTDAGDPDGALTAIDGSTTGENQTGKDGSIDASPRDAVCAPGSRVDAASGPMGSRECKPCAAGSYSSTSNATECTSWSECPAGTQISATGSDTQDRACSDCQAGSFSNTINAVACTSYTPCGPDSAPSVPGTSTVDQQCASVIPDLIWLDATDTATITKDDSNRVTQWRDKSASARHAVVPSGSAPPLWRDNTGHAGHPEIEFNGSNVRLQTAAVATTPEVTVFVVFSWSSPQAWGSIFSHGHDQYFALRKSDAHGDQLNWHIAQRNDAPLLPANLGAYQLVTTLQSNGIASMYYHPDAVATSPQANIPAGNAVLTLGNALAGANSMGGTIVELRAYSRALSAMQRSAVEAELKKKYMLGYRTCADVLTNHSAARSGSYTLDSDGSGEAAPVTGECDMSDGGWLVISSEDFTETAQGWSPIIRSGCGALGDILGGVGTFTTGTVASKVYVLPVAHSQVRLSLDFIKIGEWNNEAARITVDGGPFFEQTYSANDGPASQCGDSAPELSEHIDQSFIHSGSDLNVSVTSTLDGDDPSEAFGIDNVIVRVR